MTERDDRRQGRRKRDSGEFVRDRTRTRNGSTDERRHRDPKSPRTPDRNRRNDPRGKRRERSAYDSGWDDRSGSTQRDSGQRGGRRSRTSGRTRILNRERVPGTVAGAVLASIAVGMAFAFPEHGWVPAFGFWVFAGFASGVLAPAPEEAVGNAVFSGLVTFLVVSVGFTVWALTQVESVTVFHVLAEMVVLIYAWSVFTFALLPMLGAGWVGGKVQETIDV